MGVKVDHCVVQVKRLGNLQNYPKNGPGALELAKKMSKDCVHLAHVEAVIDLAIESCQYCPTVVELNTFIAQTRLQFSRLPSACGDCIDGWVQCWVLNSMDVSTGRWKQQKITKQEHDNLLKKVDWKHQRVADAVYPCSCALGSAVAAGHQRYTRDTPDCEW